MLNSITLKNKMILGGIAAVIVPFLIAGVIVYIQLSRSLTELTEERVVHVANDISSLISDTFEREITLANSFAADPVIVQAVKSGDYHLAEVKLSAIYERIGKPFFTIFIADKNGITRFELVFKEQIGLDISDREYFKKAIRGESSILGPVMPKGTATPGVPIFVVAAPIQWNNEVVGIVAMPFDASFTIQIVSSNNSGKTGVSFIINQQGLMLTHPTKEYILKYNLFDRPYTEDFKKALQNNKVGFANFRQNGHEMMAGFSKVELTGWYAVFAQSRTEVLEPVNRILSAISISGFIFLIITFVIIVLVSSRISNPIQKMMAVMKQITQHSSEFIIQIGSDRKIQFANPAYEKITGLSSDELIGTKANFSPAANLPHNHIWDAMDKGIPWSGRVMVPNLGPEPVPLDMMMLPLRDKEGNIQSYLQIGRDVSAELMYEQRLQQAQKLEAIGTLAGGIAHDFNNILGGIFGFAELCLLPDTTPEEHENYIKQVIVAAGRARSLVGQILTFSRKTEVELTPLFPKSVLKETLKLLRASIPATIEIQSSFNTESAIMAEPTQIHQVVMNLFTNAKFAIGDKAGIIKLELEDFYVDEEFTKTHPMIDVGKHILIRISDTGSGIPPNIRDHIFEPFFTTKPQGEGTGLGLSVVHGIVKKLGGIITVYSELGEGTNFNIIIPCTDIGGAELEVEEYPAKPGDARVIVVDDEETLSTAIKLILTNLGYRVTAYVNCREALQALQENPDEYDVLITDYSMPNCTGVEMANVLQELKINIPIIMISGYFSDTVEKAARELGITELVTKPISTYLLTDAINRLVNKDQE